MNPCGCCTLARAAESAGTGWVLRALAGCGEESGKWTPLSETVPLRPGRQEHGLYEAGNRVWLPRALCAFSLAWQPTPLSLFLPQKLGLPISKVTGDAVEVDIFNVSVAVQTPLERMYPKNSGLRGRGQTGLMLAVDAPGWNPSSVSSDEFQTLPEPRSLHF